MASPDDLLHAKTPERAAPHRHRIPAFRPNCENRMFCEAVLYSRRIQSISSFPNLLVSGIVTPQQSNRERRTCGGGGILRPRRHSSLHEPGPHAGVLCAKPTEPVSQRQEERCNAPECSPLRSQRSV